MKLDNGNALKRLSEKNFKRKMLNDKEFSNEFYNNVESLYETIEKSFLKKLYNKTLKS